MYALRFARCFKPKVSIPERKSFTHLPMKKYSFQNNYKQSPLLPIAFTIFSSVTDLDIKTTETEPVFEYKLDPNDYVISKDKYKSDL
jgi:hypothetical protein